MAAVTAAGLWAETRAVVARHRNAVLTLAAAFVFVPGAAVRLVLPSAIQPGATAAGGSQVSPMFWTLLFLVIALQVAGVFAIAAITADRAEGGGRRLGDTLAAAMPALGRFAAALGLFGVAYMAASFVLALVLGVVVLSGGISAAAVTSAGRGQPPVGLAAAVLAVVLPILIWLWARLLPLVGVYLRETEGVVAGIRRAWGLSRGSTWPLLTLLLGLLGATIGLGAVQDALPVTGVAAALLDIAVSAAGAWIFAYAAAATGIAYRELAT